MSMDELEQAAHNFGSALERSAESMRQFQNRREAARKAARFGEDGKLRPAESRNRAIAEAAIVRELVPGGRGAEFWMTYTALRDEWIRMRTDPVLVELTGHLTELQKMMDPDALNGYVAFPKRMAPRLPMGTGHITQYIPTHGGITWARKDSYMAVWGFDTMHSNSDDQPRTDQDWIRGHCWVLYRGLLLAEKLWPEFRRASQARRAEIADELLALVEEQPLMEKLGFTAMMNTMFGKIG